jgi:hypothetical protein
MMAVEVGLALLLATGILWLVLAPLIRPDSVAPEVYEPPDPMETRKGQALAALKEIEFDRATGKLSESDYHELYARYSAKAIEAMRDDDGGAQPAIADVESLVSAEVRTLEAAEAGAGQLPTCETCGPRPEPDAVFCSTCGTLLTHPALCGECNAPLEPGGHFCGRCGTVIEAAAPATP